MAQINATCIVVGRYAVIDNVRSFFHEKKKRAQCYNMLVE